MGSVFVITGYLPRPIGKQLKRVNPIPTVGWLIVGERGPVKMGASGSTMADLGNWLASGDINPFAAVAFEIAF